LSITFLTRLVTIASLSPSKKVNFFPLNIRRREWIKIVVNLSLSCCTATQLIRKGKGPLGLVKYVIVYIMIKIALH